jgi:hypothetical protein
LARNVFFYFLQIFNLLYNKYVISNILLYIVIFHEKAANYLSLMKDDFTLLPVSFGLANRDVLCQNMFCPIYKNEPLVTILSELN